MVFGGGWARPSFTIANRVAEVAAVGCKAVCLPLPLPRPEHVRGRRSAMAVSLVLIERRRFVHHAYATKWVSGTGGWITLWFSPLQEITAESRDRDRDRDRDQIRIVRERHFAGE